MRRAVLVVLLALGVPAVAHAAPTIRSSVEPADVHVGDPFRYTVVATVPERAGSTLRVVADPGAFVQISAPKVTRSSDRVTVSETLVCLDLSCVPGGSPRAISLPAPEAFAGANRVAGPRATVTVRPRVPAGAVAAARAAYRSDTTPPALTARLPLGAAAAIAMALAVALAGLSVALARSALRRTATHATATARTLPDLTLALRLLRESARRPEPDRRRAADLVARLAGRDVVDEATRVAWAEHAPGANDVEELAGAVERAERTSR